MGADQKNAAATQAGCTAPQLSASIPPFGKHSEACLRQLASVRSRLPGRASAQAWSRGAERPPGASRKLENSGRILCSEARVSQKHVPCLGRRMGYVRVSTEDRISDFR